MAATIKEQQNKTTTNESTNKRNDDTFFGNIASKIPSVSPNANLA
jgi:hypothetical protein